MREAVKILIERMESNPEDFDSYGRFGWFSNQSCDETTTSPMLTTEESTALKEAYKKFQYEKFHSRVMKSLLANSPAEEWGSIAEIRQKATASSLQRTKNSVVGATIGTFTSATSIRPELAVKAVYPDEDTNR